MQTAEKQKILINLHTVDKSEKMTAAVGFPTLRLIRIRIGSIYLGDLPVGAVKEWDGAL